MVDELPKKIGFPPGKVKQFSRHTGMQHWLIKFAPFRTSWSEIVRRGAFTLCGVRSPVARKHLASMRKGDLVFFYHSQQEVAIVGLGACVADGRDQDDVRIGRVDNQRADLAAVREVLDSYYPTEEKAEKFKGFYDIERVLGKGRRVEILKALRYLNAGGEYEELMAKIDSEHSPSECRKLAPHEDET